MNSDKNAAQGFNNAYILMKANPSLALKIADSFETPQDAYAIVFIDGTLRYVQDFNLDVEKIKNELDTGVSSPSIER